MLAALLLAGAAPPAGAGPLDGVWLADAVEAGGKPVLDYVWTSVLTLRGDRFTLSHFCGAKKPLTGSFALDPSAAPKRLDLKLDGYDLAETGMPLKIVAGTLLGIYEQDGNHLSICLTIEPGGARPADFGAKGLKIVTLRFGRATEFTKFPKDVTVRVTDPAGDPVEGAELFGFLNRAAPKAGGTTYAPGELAWVASNTARTGADGTARFPYEELRFHTVSARHAERNLIASAAGLSPLALQRGALTLQLGPQVRLTGVATCEELTKGGGELGFAHFYLEKAGRRVAFSASKDGRFEFPVAPGDYTLHAYGSDLHGKKVPVTVPADRTECEVPPIALTASKLRLLQGKPAPELAGVVGWKGEPAKLADLRGKWVLLEFWGYWCGPCVASMPVLIELHEKYADKGVAVIGVHLDGDGEVDTPAKYDEKVAGYVKDVWGGKPLPFPVALASGRQSPAKDGEMPTRGGPAEQYGVLSYPTTVLIDPQGRVVGQFAAREAKAACAAVEKLLAGGK